MKCAFLFCLVFALPVLAATPKSVSIPYPGTTDSILVPVDSPMHFSGFANNAGGKSAMFKGRVLLTGTYYYGDGEYNDGPIFEGQASILPDADMAKRLPRFALRGAHFIFVDNADAFADAVLSKAVLAHVRRKNGGYATGHITIWVDQFRGSIVCDGPEFSARFLSVYKPPAMRVAAKEPSLGC